MPGFRFPVSVPASLSELFERIRELLPQLELKVLPNRPVGTTETVIAHGLKSTPVFVVTGNPHCIAIVKETRRADSKHVYLKATNSCVVNVWTLAVGSLGASIVPDGGYRLPDWDPSGDALGDHKFSVDAADEAADGADFAETKIVATTGASVSKGTGAHGKTLQIGATGDHLIKARTADVTTVGGAYDKTANSETITREVVIEGGVEKVKFNAVPPVPATGGGSWLYTGSIQADNLLDPVIAHIKTGSGGGAQDSAGIDWKPLENGDLEHWDWTGGNPATHTGGSPLVGELHGLDTTGSSTIDLNVGDRVWMTYTESEVVGGETVYYRRGGICTVVRLGDASSSALLRQVAADMVDGNVFKEVGVGGEFENWYWEIDVLPNGYFLTFRSDYVNTTTYNLLTSTEVSRAGSTTRETSVTILGGTSGWTNFEIPLFEMLSGVNVSSIPKGMVNWEVLAYVVADDPTATIAIRAFLSLAQGSAPNFAYAEATLHNETPAVIKMQGTIPADIACSPTDKLSAIFYGYSSSASPITIRLVYNSATHATRVQTPIVTGSFGTLDHQLLTMESRGFPAGQEVAAVAYRHPMDAIEPGRILTPSNDRVIPVAGLFAVPVNSNYVEIDGTDDVIGISTAGWTGTNSKIDVFFFNQRVLKRSQEVPDGYADLAWGTGVAGYGEDIDTLTVYSDCVVSFRLIGGKWRIVGMMNL